MIIDRSQDTYYGQPNWGNSCLFRVSQWSCDPVQILPRTYFLHNIKTRLQELMYGIKRVIISQSIFQRQKKLFLLGLEYCHRRTNQMIIAFYITYKRIRQPVESRTRIIHVSRPKTALEITSTVLGLTNFIYTIPSIALFGFLIPFSGIGNTTAIIALSIYALLPMVHNTYTGIIGIDKEIIEAARGMGSTTFQILYKIQIPLAFPVILSGIRNMVVNPLSKASGAGRASPSMRTSPSTRTSAPCTGSRPARTSPKERSAGDERHRLDHRGGSRPALRHGRAAHHPLDERQPHRLCPFRRHPDDRRRIHCRPVQPQPGRHHLRGRGATAGQARQTGQAPPPARHPARHLRLVAAHRPGVSGAGRLHRGAPARPPPPLPLLPPVLCPQLRQRIGSRDPPAAPAGRLDRRRQPTGFQGLVPVIPAIQINKCGNVALITKLFPDMFCSLRDKFYICNQ